MHSILPVIAHLYKIPFDETIEKVTKGFLSENFILTDDTTNYFLKKYRFDNEEKIRKIHQVKEYFSDGGIPVIRPIPGKDNQTFFSHEGNYYALFPFVKGRQLTAREMTEKAVISLGEMLGAIHLLGKKSTLAIEGDGDFKAWNKERFLKDTETILEKINATRLSTDFDKLALKSILLKKDLVEKNTLTFEQFGFSNDHLLHGDYFAQNVFFNENDEVSFVFDFEKAGYGPRYFEVVRSMLYSVFKEKPDKKDIGKGKLYLDSYCKIYPLTQDEITKSLQAYYLRTIHGCWIESEHYLRNNYRVDDLLESSIDRVVFLSENLDELTEALVT